MEEKKRFYDTPRLEIVLLKNSDLIQTSVYDDDGNISDGDWT